MKPFLLRIWRLAVVMSVAGIVRHEHRWLEAQQRIPVGIAQAQRIFPQATRVAPRDVQHGWHAVFQNDGTLLGYVLTTAPECDQVIGYCGPTNVLMGLFPDGALLGLDVLSSEDTPDHVQLIRDDERFLRGAVGWKPSDGPLPVDAVSGATLTSAAILESVQRRLIGKAPSLRFPEPVTLEEIRLLFPTAHRTEPDGSRLRVIDQSGALLGFVLRTSPASDAVGGYRGPTESLVALKPDGRTIAALRIRKSYDTPEYVQSVKDDDYWMKEVFVGRTTVDIAQMKWEQAGIEGVSGATQTSYAMAEGLKRRFAESVPQHTVTTWQPRAHDLALVAIVLGSLVMSFTHLRGRRWVRRVWQVFLVGYLGIISGELLSIGLAAGWLQNGLPWRTASGLAVLFAASLLIPWSTGRQTYCLHICPHGAAQEWLGRWRSKKLHVLRRLQFWLGMIPGGLLVFAVAVLVSGWPIDLTRLEPFDAWSWRAAAWAMLAFAVISLIASIFVPQAYCRFGCPTGALLNFVRTHRGNDQFGRRDWLALAVVVVCFCVRPSLWQQAPITPAESPQGHEVNSVSIPE